MRVRLLYRIRRPGLGVVILLWAALASLLWAADEEPAMSPEAARVAHDASVFRPDPQYDAAYAPEEQLEIYSGKHPNPTTRPLLELGRQLYQAGPFRKAEPGLLGKKNLFFPYAYVYGDWRTAVAYNDNGDTEQGTIATRLNLDIDVKLTATERAHAFMKPVDKDGEFTRYDFAGDRDNELEIELDGNVDALFFEGDLGAILAGVTNHYMPFDLPFAVGLMPLLFQNGIWLEDAFTGLAVTIPAQNSRFFDVSNADLTFFVGVDEVTSGAAVDQGKIDDDNAHLFGLAAFIEAYESYFEMGYGFTDLSGNLDDADVHNLTASVTRRYAGLLSNSLRVLFNFGQERERGAQQTADGAIFLMENSLVTSKPSALVPYYNLFLGLDRPQSLARDAGAGGILKNTGILFETDGLTGFPKMDDTGRDVWGGAVGLEYLFGLDRQLVVEGALLNVISGDETAKGNQFGFGLRYQHPLTHAVILRADSMIAWRGDESDLLGFRLELRWKF